MAWQQKSLGDIIQFKNGKKRPATEGAVPVYGGNGILGYANNCNYNCCIIIGRVGAYCGSVYYEENACWVSDNAIAAQPKSGTDTRFAYYLLKSLNLNERHIGTSQPLLTQEILNRIECKIPPLQEQAQIASVLSALDDKITINCKINDNLQQQLFALYNELITAHETHKTVKLKTLCAFQEGYVNPPQTHPEYFDGSIKWLRAVDINESFIIETSRTLTTSGFESAKKSALLFQPNTIAISKSGTIGRIGIIADNMCGNRAVINVRPLSLSQLPLIYAYLKSKQGEFPDLAVGSVQKNLYVSILEELQVDLPGTELVDQFCDIGYNLLMQIQNNCKESLALANLRNALLPKLMSGEVDVRSVCN